MQITVVGATGMVGSRVVAEAASRGHQVLAVSRSGRTVEGATDALAVDMADTPALVAAMDRSDASVIAVPGDRGGDQDAMIGVHEQLVAAAPKHPFLVVGGAGSLLAPDGTTLKDTPGFPAEYKAEADTFTHVLERYRASTGLRWTLISPAPVLAPGERTGKVVLGLDEPVGETISAEDLAVAIVDELESGAHEGRRFTAATATA